MSSLRAQIDGKSQRFLQAVEYYGGEATITEIRKHTGLNRDETNYRFIKLDGLGLITISRGEHQHPNRPAPKVAALTGSARREIERGFCNGTQDGTAQTKSPAVSPEIIEDLQTEVTRLTQRVNVLTQEGSNAPTGELEERVAALERHQSKGIDHSQPGSVTGHDISSLKQRVSQLEDRDETIEASVSELDEFVTEWTEAGETYLLALGKVLEEKLDIPMESYLDTVTEEMAEESDFEPDS